MKLALSGKNKIGFITGTIKKPAEGNLLSTWKCNNDAIASWIINSVSKEIAASDKKRSCVDYGTINFE